MTSRPDADGLATAKYARLDVPDGDHASTRDVDDLLDRQHEILTNCLRVHLDHCHERAIRSFNVAPGSTITAASEADATIAANAATCFLAEMTAIARTR